MRIPAPLKYFQAVAEHGSIRQAADAINVANSAISRHIQELEEDFGCPLIERSARGVNLTEAGRAYLSYCNDLVARQDSLAREMYELKQGDSGHVRLFSVEGSTPTLIGPALSHFNVKYPGISVEHTIAGTFDVLEALKTSQADVGLVLMPEQSDVVESLFRFSDELCLVVAADSQLAAHAEASWEDLMSIPLAVPAKGFRIRQLVDLAWDQKGSPLKPALETNSIAMLRHFVEAGHGGAFLNRLSLDRNSAVALKALPLPITFVRTLTTDICVAANRHRSPAINHLLNFIGEFGLSLGYRLENEQ